MKVSPIICTGTAEFDHRFQHAWEIRSHTFSQNAFEETLLNLVKYPERSSSAILRADILEDDRDVAKQMDHIYDMDSDRWTLHRVILRRLLPRNPGMDRSMTQLCSFYSSTAATGEALVIYEPLEPDIPYYHPKVKALAFLYTPERTRIAFVPFGISSTAAEADCALKARIDRTLFQLLSIIGKHSTGTENNYVKRVEHDLIIPKNASQDLYTVLKGKYAHHYVENWAECTDPRKHVFEDLAIAAFIILLHKQILMLRGGCQPLSVVDIGCGNGLLVELLLREGLSAYGFDARARKSWSTYLPQTRAVLYQRVFHPSLLSVDTDTVNPMMQLDSPLPETDLLLHDGIFSPDEFLVGNHADELTPYIPLVAALASLRRPRSSFEMQDKQVYIDTAGFMIIPCCTYTFSGKKHTGLLTKGGRYASYIKWLIGICEEVGWVVEREALRIPSTRNHAIIGRKRRVVEGQLKDYDNEDFQDDRQRLLQICRDIIARNAGMQDFLQKGLSLTRSKPRTH